MAYTLTGRAVMIRRDRTVYREVVAGVGFRAEACSNLKVNAVSTIVMIVAARWNIDALRRIRTPALANRANALSRLAIVIGDSGA